MPTPFEELGERLLAGGIAPRHVRRYLAELADHLADLRRDHGDDALARLGTVDQLAAAMLAKPELRSWTARAPWATLVLGPVAALAAMSVVLTGFIAFCAFALRTTDQPHPMFPAALQSAILGLAAGLVFVAPVLIGWLFAAAAIRQRITGIWPFLGLIVFAIVSGAYDYSVVFPKAAGQLGELQIGFGWAPPFPDTSKNALHGIVNLVLMAAPYLAWRLRRKEADRLLRR
jgi:hypothetical protein